MLPFNDEVKSPLDISMLGCKKMSINAPSEWEMEK